MAESWGSIFISFTWCTWSRGTIPDMVIFPEVVVNYHGLPVAVHRQDSWTSSNFSITLYIFINKLMQFL